ncbi:MAG: malectin domain-containing carbohydrate-binding protein, partial [Actinomycetota bacterium]
MNVVRRHAKRRKLERIFRICVSVMMITGTLYLVPSTAGAAETALYRVNAGGGTLTGTPDWTADTAANPSPYVNALETGNTVSSPNVTVTKHSSVPADVPVELFKTERWDGSADPEMKWAFPVTGGSSYVVRLYFAETYTGNHSVGKRIFDVSIEGDVVLDNYDIFADVGGNKGVMKEFTVSSDSSLDIEFGHVVENPVVKGIEILPADSSPNELGVSPSSLSFGSVDVNGSKEMDVTLTNLGGDTTDPAITVEAAAISGPNMNHFTDNFVDSGTDVVLAPGQSTTVVVTYEPTEAGGMAASLDVTHSGSNTPLTVALNGNGNEVLPGTWQSLPSNSVSRQEVAYVQVNGKFYLAGGLVEGATAVEMYDPIAKTWSTVAQLPESLDHIQAVAIGSKIYYIGGLNHWPGPDSGNVYIFDTKTNTFTEGAPMPAARQRGAGGVAVHNGKIYYAGGLHASGGTSVAVNWFDVYDPDLNTWSALTDMPNSRDHFHAAVLNGKFYAIGGRNQAIGNILHFNQAYDFSTGQWAAGLAPLPSTRAGFATAVIDDEIIVLGGEGGGIAHGTVEAYKPSTNTWRSLTSMPNPRHGIQAAVCNDGIYLAAGGISQGNGPSKVHDVFFPGGSATECLPPAEAGALGASPTNFGFGNVQVGTTKNQTIQLTNLGTGSDPAIVVDNTTIEGADAGQFSDSFNDAGNISLPPGQSTSFQATFAPTTGGSKAATLKVHHDGTNDPINIALSGTSNAPGSVVYRINAGGPIVSDVPQGWAADTTNSPAGQVNSGNTASGTGATINMTHGSIPPGTPQAIFKDERFDQPDDPNMEWNFAVAPGDYEVRLYFTELFHTSANQRKFDVTIEGGTALKDYDVFKAAGAKNKGVMESFKVSTDSNLDIDFVRGLENPTVAAIEILEADTEVAAEDAFTRNVTDSWGTADTGGAWNVLAGSAANFDVNGTGKIVAPNGAGQQLIHLPGTSLLNVDYKTNITFSNKPGGGSGEHFAYLVVRRQSNGAYYRIGAVVDASGNVSIRGQNNTGTNLFDDVDTPVGYNPGDVLILRVTAHGSNPTTLRAKVWKAGTAEPGTWNVSTSDGAAGPQ